MLQEAPRAYNTQVQELLLAAVYRAFSKWSGGTALLVDLEGHGREEIFPGVHLSRTVGWFTTMVPVLLEVDAGAADGDAIKAVKEQLRAIPDRGISYGLLRYLSREPAVRDRMKGLPRPEVVFLYLGRLDVGRVGGSLLAVAPESSGPQRSPRNPRSHRLEIDAQIVSQRLEMRWSYSRNVHRRETIEAAAHESIAALRRLLDHCRDPESGGFTPSDFSASSLSQADLEKIARKMAAGGSRQAE